MLAFFNDALEMFIVYLFAIRLLSIFICRFENAWKLSAVTLPGSLLIAFFVFSRPKLRYSKGSLLSLPDSSQINVVFPAPGTPAMLMRFFGIDANSLYFKTLFLAW